MGLVVILPVKAPREAKSRLSSVLSEENRATLSWLLFRHVFKTVQIALPVASILVVSADQEVLKAATTDGAQAITDPSDGGLNDAINAALSKCSPDDAVLILPADLPTLTASDIQGVIDETNRATFVIAPDEDCSGTNALLMTPPNLVPASFGKNSFARHCEAARCAGIEPEIVRLPGIAFDLDEVADLDRLPDTFRSGSG